MKKLTYLKKPLTKRALKHRADKDGYISVNIIIDLYTLIDLDLEGFNEFADESILSEDLCASLSDISYKIIGSIPGTKTTDGSAIIQVVADVSEVINGDNE